jgi:hypothetical protein
MIDDLKRLSNREVREGKKKGARAFLPVSFFMDFLPPMRPLN